MLVTEILELIRQGNLIWKKYSKEQNENKEHQTEYDLSWNNIFNASDKTDTEKSERKSISDTSCCLNTKFSTPQRLFSLINNTV